MAEPFVSFYPNGKSPKYKRFEDKVFLKDELTLSGLTPAEVSNQPSEFYFQLMLGGRGKRGGKASARKQGVRRAVNKGRSQLGDSFYLMLVSTSQASQVDLSGSQWKRGVAASASLC